MVDNNGFFAIETGETGKAVARLYGYDRSSLDLASTHCFAGALMPALREARAKGELTRAQYKRAKDLIEARMRQNMQYDASRSYPYNTVRLRDVRDEVRRLERIAA